VGKGSGEKLSFLCLGGRTEEEKPSGNYMVAILLGERGRGGEEIHIAGKNMRTKGGRGKKDRVG